VSCHVPPPIEALLTPVESGECQCFDKTARARPARNGSSFIVIRRKDLPLCGTQKQKQRQDGRKKAQKAQKKTENESREWS
jgi:hypothetical protein